MYIIEIQAAALSYPINALVAPAAWHTELPQGKLQKLPQVDIRIGTPIWNHHFFNGFNLSIVRFRYAETQLQIEQTNTLFQCSKCISRMAHYKNQVSDKYMNKPVNRTHPHGIATYPRAKEVTPDGDSYWHRHLEV